MTGGEMQSFSEKDINTKIFLSSLNFVFSQSLNYIKQINEYNSKFY